MVDPKKEAEVKKEASDQDEDLDELLDLDDIERRTAELRVGDRICNHVSKTPIVPEVLW